MASEAIPSKVLAQHVAVLGKTGSGKTSTAKLAVEQLVADGGRVCVLDPIKSDWWGLTSSADGRHAGLEFSILGGPRGHVLLHSTAGKAVGELVASGALRLSIIDMADFEPGGLQKFFVDFAPALLRGMRGVVHLVVEEAHEFAPKERSGIGDENHAVYWAKKLATAGRSKGIRLILATQRTQALHNALLGSCETMIVHRLTAPADQEPVKQWLKANTSKEHERTVAESLSSLKTGTGWICSAEAGIFEQRAFPPITTFDNSATPTKNSGRREVTTAAVDRERLRSVIGEAVQEAEANDPAKLREEIARLKRELVTSLSRSGEHGSRELRRYNSDLERERSFLRSDNDALRAAIDRFAGGLEQLAAGMRNKPEPVKAAPPPPSSAAAPPPATARRAMSPASAKVPAAAGDIPGPGRKILNSLATWSAMGHEAPGNAQVAWLAGYSPTSTSYTNPRGALRSGGFIEYPSPDRVALTPHGAACARASTINGTLLDHVGSLLPGPEARILAGIAHYHPQACSNAEAATSADYSSSSTSYTNPRGALKTKELITYPGPGQVRAADWLFAKGGAH